VLAANYSTVRDNFKEFCDKANDDAETIFITRKAGGNVVLISESEYNNLMENLFVRSGKKNYARLMESIQQLKAGKATEKALVDD
jgi:antitoxin YefM